MMVDKKVVLDFLEELPRRLPTWQILQVYYAPNPNFNQLVMFLIFN